MATILLVDDEESVRKVVSEALTLSGHHVTAAPGGADALERLQRDPYDVVVLDIVMPGMDGYQVLEAIRDMPERRGIPVIVVTGRHDPEGVRREAERGAIDHLVKPFFPSELEAAIDRALGSPDQREDRLRRLTSEAEVYELVGELFEQVRSADVIARR